jgi:pyruvate,water dikinase
MALGYLRTLPGGVDFVASFETFMDRHMDVAYDGQRLAEHPSTVLHIILRMAQELATADSPKRTEMPKGPTALILERRLLDAVGQARHAEAREVLETARLSWRLRDDDNVLVGRLESQLYRALRLALGRLRARGLLQGKAEVSVETAPLIAQVLQDPLRAPVDLAPPQVPERSDGQRDESESPRQLVGQPAAPGVATGIVRRVRGAEDLGQFLPGEVLVCDAIQPTMTHLVPLACAVVERRGGMLIHGAIIARELGIPCVNGIAGVIESLQDGELVTVDGYLGIVTVGPPEFELEGVAYRESPR